MEYDTINNIIYTIISSMLIFGMIQNFININTSYKFYILSGSFAGFCCFLALYIQSTSFYWPSLFIILLTTILFTLGGMIGHLLRVYNPMKYIAIILPHLKQILISVFRYLAHAFNRIKNDQKQNSEKKYVNQTTIEEKKSPSNSWAAWFIAIIVPTVIAISSILLQHRHSPEFIILNSELTVNDALIIQANNNQANQKKELDVYFDDVAFPKKAIPVKTDSVNQQWKFSLKENIKVKKLLTTGDHFVRVAFPGEKLSVKHRIILNAD